MTLYLKLHINSGLEAGIRKDQGFVIEPRPSKPVFCGGYHEPEKEGVKATEFSESQCFSIVTGGMRANAVGVL